MASHAKGTSSINKKVQIEEDGGNVFAGIGLPNAEERLAKADLAICSLLEQHPRLQVAYNPYALHVGA